MFEEHLVRQFGICANFSLDGIVKREFILWLRVHEAWMPLEKPDNDELPKEYSTTNISLIESAII